MKLYTLLFSAAISLPVLAQTQPVPPSQNASVKPSASTTIVVTASFVPQPLLETNRSVDVLPLQPLLLNNVEDTLREDPSVDLEERGPDGTQADISIRGTTFEQSLVLINGLRVNDVESGHLNMDISLPPDAISHVEVLHGAGSTFFGSDAMGGAVNFITTSPQHTSMAFSAGDGNFGTYQSKFDGSYSAAKWSEQFSAARDFSDGFMVDRDYRADLGSSETWFKDAAGAADFLIGTNDRPYGANQFYGPYNSYERTKGWFTAYRQQFGQQTEADFGYRRHTDEFVLFRTSPSVYENNHIDHSWQAMLRRHNDPHANTTLSYGIEGDGDQIASNNLGHHGRNRGSGYINLDVHALGRLTFSAGARNEVFDGGRDVFSPAASAGYFLGKGIRLRASVSHGFRLPTFTDLYYTDPTHTDNPNLKPESAWDYEAGADWNNNGRLTASLTVFRSSENNVIDYVRPVSGTVYMAENIDQLNFTGVESSLHYRLASTQELIFGYTGITSNLSVPSNEVFEYTSSYPTQNASVLWQGSIHHQVEAHMRVGVIQRYQQTAYPLWSASLARNTGRLRPYVQLDNLSNTGYTEIAGIAMPGRSYIAGLQYFWSRTK